MVFRRFNHVKLPTTTADVTSKAKAKLHKAGFIQKIWTVILNLAKITERQFKVRYLQSTVCVPKDCLYRFLQRVDRMFFSKGPQNKLPEPM